MDKEKFDCKRNETICIERISISTRQNEFVCAHVKDVTPNRKCNKIFVENYISSKCQGMKGKCILFNRYTEISEHCKAAFQYVHFEYNCGKFL